MRRIVEHVHGDTAPCKSCGETLTYKTDRATPYWEHPNLYPYCRDARGVIHKADPDRKVRPER